MTESRPALPSHFLLPALVLGLISLLLVVWILTFGMQLFSGMDGGVLINAAWQEYHGAVPYRDFFTGVPPLFVLPAGWAFDLWGPSWHSLITLNCIFSVTTFCWSFAIIRNATKSPVPAILTAFLLQAIIVLPSSWWWYNELTCMGSVLFFASTLSLLAHTPSTFFARLSFVVSAAALSLLKANVAGPILVCCFLLLVFHRQHRVFVILTAPGIALFDLLFLAANHISPEDLLTNYLAVSGRLNGDMFFFLLKHPDEFDYGLQLWSLPLLMIGIFVGIHQFPWSDPDRQRIFNFLLLIAMLFMIIGTVTNYQRKALGSACLVVMLPYLHAHLRSSKLTAIKWARNSSWTIALALSVIGCFVGANRFQFFYFGIDSFATPQFSFRVSGPPLFAGLRLSNAILATMGDTNRALIKYGVLGPNHKSVFFGPSLDSCYALFDLPAPKNFPLWWEQVPSTHRGDRYPYDEHAPLFCNDPTRWIMPGQPLDPRVQRFLDDKFDVCIFLNAEHRTPVMSFLPGDIRAVMYEDYVMHRYAHISVFVRRQDSPHS